MTPRTAAGYLKFRPIHPGSRVALVAPASPFPADLLPAGVAELRRLQLEPVYDDRVFERDGFLAGSAAARGAELARALTRDDIDLVVAIRGGYGSVHALGALDVDLIRRTRTAFVGYSDLTSVHAYLGTSAGLASVHGPMIEGRFAKGTAAYDERSFLRSLGPEPLGECAPDGLETVHTGEAVGPVVGGTLTQLLASIGTPFEFRPPDGHVLFIDEVHERPYRLHRMLTQWILTGRLARASALVFGELPDCDEPGGAIGARDVVRTATAGFPGPVVFGLPSGHSIAPSISMPFGVRCRVVASAEPRVVFEEAAAA